MSFKPLTLLLSYILPDSLQQLMLFFPGDASEEYWRFMSNYLWPGSARSQLHTSFFIRATCPPVLAIYHLVVWPASLSPATPPAFGLSWLAPSACLPIPNRQLPMSVSLTVSCYGFSEQPMCLCIERLSFSQSLPTLSFLSLSLTLPSSFFHPSSSPSITALSLSLSLSQ